MGDLFTPVPEQWGLRGDPYAWDAMRAHLDADPVPDTGEAVARVLADAFERVVGTPLRNSAEAVYVEAFAHGGMSSGQVHIPTWRDTLIPLLERRAAETS